MQPCNRIYYSTIHWRLNMFRAAYRSSSGAVTVFAASGLHTHVVTGRSQVWVGTQTQKLLMMSGMLLETCWAFNERWNNKFCYKVASCWLFLLSPCIMLPNKWPHFQLLWIILINTRFFLFSYNFINGCNFHKLETKHESKAKCQLLQGTRDYI